MDWIADLRDCDCADWLESLWTPWAWRWSFFLAVLFFGGLGAIKEDKLDELKRHK